jgi:hypothetical protein
MTPWRHHLRVLSILALIFSICAVSAGCKSKAEVNAEVKKEQKQESEAPKTKDKTEFIVQKQTIPGVPQSLAEFKTLHGSLATTAEGAAAVFVAALLAQSQKISDAPQMLAMTLTPNQLTNGALGTQANERFVRGISDRPNVAASYVSGASPENGYKLPSPPFTVEVHLDPTASMIGGDSKKIFVWSSGAGKPRPIEMRRQSNGLWLVHEASSLSSGVANKK